MPDEKSPVGPHLYGRPLTEGEIKSLPPDAYVISSIKDVGFPSRFRAENSGRFPCGGFSLYDHFLISLPPGAADPPPPPFKVGQCVESLAGHRGVVTETYVMSDGLRRYTVGLPGDGAGHLPGFLETEIRELPADLERQVAELKSEVEDARKSIACAEGLNGEFRDVIAARNREVGTLRNSLREAESVALGRTREADALRAERDKLLAENEKPRSSPSEDAATLRAERDAYHRDAIDLQRRTDNQSKMIQELDQTTKRLNAEAKHLRAERDANYQIAIDCRSANDSHCRFIRDQGKTIERLQDEALRLYAHDGTYRVLNSAEDVVKARIDAAGVTMRLGRDLEEMRGECNKHSLDRFVAEHHLGRAIAENATLAARLDELRFYGRPLTQEDAAKLPLDASFARFRKGVHFGGWNSLNREATWIDCGEVETYLLTLPETGR